MSPLFQGSEPPFLGNKERSYTHFSEGEKYISLRRTMSVLFIGLMAWPRRWRFKLRSVGEVKAFKCLASRKGIISLVKCKRSYSNLEKGSNPSRNSQKAVSLEKGTLFQSRFKTKLLWEARTRSYLDAKLSRHEATQNSEFTLFLGELIPIWKQGWKRSWTQPLWRRSHFTYHQSKQFKYFGVWTIPLQTHENFEGDLVDTLKKTRFLTGLNNV